MQREANRRGFILAHQKVALEIDFSGSIRGYTELTIVPLTRDLKSIHLHCRQCVVTKVTVASLVADYIHYDPLVHITSSNPADVHLYPEIKRKVYSALSEGDEGELSIGVPQEVVSRQEQAFDTQAANASADNTAVGSDATSIVVRIEYSVRNPAEGLEFVLPSEVYPYRVPHMYTTPSVPDAARCWVPCVDNLWERCTWDLEFVVPRFLDAPSEAELADGATDEGNYPVVVIASGELAEQVAHPWNSSKVIFIFNQPVPTSIQHIAFAAGPFHVHELPIEESPAEADKEDEEESMQAVMHMFCLPGLEPMLRTTTAFYRSAMQFYSTLGPYPFSSFKAVFVDELPTHRFDSATLSIMSNDLLYGEDAIEQVFDTRQSLSHALAVQWIGINILPKTWADTWLINGVGLYITALYFRKVFGNNEYRFRLKKDMDRIVQLDVGTQSPICQPSQLDPPEAASFSFINLKAPVVLYILDRHLGKSGTSHGLSRVIPKILLSAISGDLAGNTLSTSSFLRTCRKISGVDPRTFAEQWIYGSGCPHFAFSANFNRKKLVVEFMMRQSSPAFEANRDNPVALAQLNPVPFFEGTITVRIHEADGTPYEHVLDIRSPQKHYEVLFNTKYKRVRRNTKRYISRKAAALAAAAGDQEAAEDIGLLDEAFGLGMWEDESERAKWRVADWTEEDEQRMATATYEWIRMDADFEWIGLIAFDQPDYMWVSQLQRDRDVVAQIEALHSLVKQPSNVTSSFLTHTVLVQNYFYRVRMEAAMLLIKCAIPALGHIGIFHLLKIFTAYCFQPQQKKHEFSTRFIPRPNDFSNIPEYFVRKSIITSLAQFRHSAEMDYVVPRFLIDQLKFNDNTTNPYSDGLYISTLIAAVGSTLLPLVAPEQSQLIATTQAPGERTQAAELLRQAAMEVERYREMDRLVPSVHNVVSIAALEWYLMLIMGNMIPNDGSIFLKYTREGNFTGVRIAAFDGLLLMKWYSSKTLIRYLMAVVAHDSSRVIRRHVARGICESFGILFAIGDIPWAGSKAQDVLIEEDGSVPTAEKKNPKKKDLDTLTKSLRQHAGKQMSLRECIMPIILAPDTDPQVRMCMIKICDLLYRANEESVPTLKITLPATPATELPPPVPSPITPAPPSLKIKNLGRRMSSFNTPHPPSPSPSTPSILPKLRLTTAKPLDARSPFTATVDVFPDEQLMPPPPVPERAREKQVPIPKKKDKQLPKSQASGMHSAEVSVCRRIVKKLYGKEESTIFRQPVDPVRDRAPGYFDRIKNPMDLSTISAKLEAGAYPDRPAFKEDFKLMIKNAQLYNPPGTFAHKKSKELEVVFTKLWEKAAKTFDAAVVKSNQTIPMNAPVADDMATAALALEVEPVSEQERLAQEAADDLLTALVESVPTAPAPAPVVVPPSARPLKLKFSASTPSSKPASKPASPAPTPAPAPVGASRFANGLPEPVEAATSTARPPKPLKLFKAPKPPKLVVAPPKPPVPNFSITQDDDPLFAELDMIEAEKSHTPSPSKKGKHKERGSRESTQPTEDSWLLDLPKDKQKGKERPEKRKSPGDGVRSAPAPAAAPVPVAVPAAPKQPRPSVKISMRKDPPPAIPQIRQSATTPLPAANSMPIDVSKCKSITARLKKKHPNYLPFSAPVDAIAQGCPTYYDEIKNPMDFLTLETRLDAGHYHTMQEFEADLRLIFSNCRQFNPPGTYLPNLADEMEETFNGLWAKATERKLSSADRAAAIKIISALMNDGSSYFFRVPVDPVVMGIPHYFTIIKREDARDLKTIKANVQGGKYDSLEGVAADIDLLVENAIKFNGKDSAAAGSARTVQALWNTALRKHKKSTEAQKSNSAGEPPTKKLKVA